MKYTLFGITLLVLSWSPLFGGITVLNPGYHHQQLVRTLHHRLAHLRETSLTGWQKNDCSKDSGGYLTFSEQFGRTGNILLQFTHGLWFAHEANMTFVISEVIAAH